MASNLIEKLNCRNYSTWSADMKFLLIEKGVWSIIEKEECLPKLSEKITQDYIETVKLKLNLAMSIIYLNIEPEFKRLIDDCTEPVDAWKRLRKNFHPDGRAHQMALFSQLIDCRIKGGESINMFAARLKKIYLDLKSIDKDLSENYVSYQLLRYLPATFDSVVQLLLCRPDETFSFNLLVDELVSEETRMMLRDKDAATNACVSSNATTKFSRHRPARGRRCWTCGDPKHLQSSCPSRGKSHPTRGRSKQDSRSHRKSSPSTSESPEIQPEYRRHRQPRGQRRRSSFQSSPSSSDLRHRKAAAYQSDTDSELTSNDESRKSTLFVSHCNLSNVSNVVNDCEWIFDSGATHHFCNNRDLFTKFSEVKNDNMSVAAKGVHFPILGKGEVRLKFGQRIFTLCDVMYSDKLRKNLLSGPQIDKMGLNFVGGQGEVKIFRKNQYLFSAYLKNRAYILFPKIPSPSKKRVTFENLSLKKDESMLKWHRRMGHVSQSLIAHTSKKNGVRGLPILKETDFVCEPCRLGKFRSISHKYSKEIRSKRPLELLYADLWGPCQNEGRNGERYFLSVIDDFSRRVSIYTLKLKSETPEILKRHIIRAENYLDKRVKSIRTDNGREFVNNALKEFFDQKGIKPELTNPYSPQMNGTAERFMQTAADGIRTLLIESNMDTSFWPEALKYFVYTWNRVCPKLLTKTPFELYGGRKPSVRHLKPFGIACYVGIPKQKRAKLDAKAKKGFLVGYAFNTRGYRIWTPENNDIIESSNVNFDESCCGPKRSGAVLGTEDFSLFPPVVDRRGESILEVDPVATPGPSNAAQSSQPEREGESDSMSDKAGQSTITPFREVSWVRKPTKRNMRGRTYIYYYEENKNVRLRSLNNVRDYCNENKIVFKPELFDFSGSNRYSGLIPIPVDDNTEADSDDTDSISDTDSVNSSQASPRA